MTRQIRDFPCEAVSIAALVQQISVQLIPRGYWWYVTGTIRDGVQPEHVDATIINKYDLRKDWRYRAELKARGFANVEYIRCGTFYVILATQGRHPFKTLEWERVRCLKKTTRREGCHFAPLQVPVEGSHRTTRKKRKRRSVPRQFEGYSISCRQGRYQRKTAEQRHQYRQAVEAWKRDTLLGRKLPKPQRGRPDAKWRTHTAIEKGSFRRLRSYLLNIAVHRSRAELEAEFQRVPYEPYWAIKQQLLMILGQVNRARKAAGVPPEELLPYKVVLGAKRDQIPVFVNHAGIRADD